MEYSINNQPLPYIYGGVVNDHLSLYREMIKNEHIFQDSKEPLIDIN